MSSSERADDALLNPIVVPSAKPSGEEDEDWADILGYSPDPGPEATPLAQTSEEERALLAQHGLGQQDAGSVTAENIVVVDHGVRQTKPRMKLGQKIGEDAVGEGGTVGETHVHQEPAPAAPITTIPEPEVTPAAGDLGGVPHMDGEVDGQDNLVTPEFLKIKPDQPKPFRIEHPDGRVETGVYDDAHGGIMVPGHTRMPIH